MKRNYIVVAYFISLIGLIHNLDAWTWSFAKRITQADLNKDKKNCYFTRIDTPHFSQLIFSWNGFRPENGHLSIKAQALVNGQWQPMHHIIDWGKKIQHSYFTKNEITSAHHVRLEVTQGNKAQGFRIYVQGHNGADLTGLKAIFACVSDLSQFKAESISYSNLKSVRIHNVPRQSQMMLNHPDGERMCSVTSTSMLVGYLQGKMIDPIHFGLHSYDTGLDSYGSWPFNMAHAFEAVQGTAYFCNVRLPSFLHLHKQLTLGIPVAVSVRGNLEGGVKPYNNGHIILVTGFDAVKQKVLCHDPAFALDEHVEVAYNLSDFLRAWERSQRLSYIAEPIKS